MAFLNEEQARAACIYDRTLMKVGLVDENARLEHALRNPALRTQPGTFNAQRLVDWPQRVN